ncbi:hypothetical protein ACLMAL_26485 [Nocardia sp. CWNU-33]|uniref:hypothetical protein n=1 Tax=Nocardia sp. CWNU-33 TaxID=3392117 RepID=UPI00398F1153
MTTALDVALSTAAIETSLTELEERIATIQTNWTGQVADAHAEWTATAAEAHRSYKETSTADITMLGRGDRATQ